MKYAFVNGIILDGTKDMEPVAGKAVLTDGKKIAGIVSDTAALQGYELIDLKGAYLLPGLIDLHVHLALSGRPPKAESKPKDYGKLYRLLTGNKIVRAAAKKLVAGYAKSEVMSGVTTIRTVGGVLDFDAQVRDLINEGKLTGPRIIAANTGISVPGGHFAGSIATAVSSPEEARELVHQIAATKPDLIKLMITGGVMDSDAAGMPGVLKMPPEIVKAACDEAHKLGYKVAAHVESPEGVRVALENGVDTVEHGARLTDETIKLFKERKAADICTLSPAIPYAMFELEESHATEVARNNGRIVLDGVIDCAKTCIENDIPVGLGSDVSCPFVVHYNFWRELYYFNKYIGRSAKETLYRATLGNASIIGIDKETGSIEEGKCADMIVVKDDPLNDLTALKNVSMVIARGNLIRKPKHKKMSDIDKVLDRYM
ncbi:MAG: amidohydrolase family protein [Erysipelotrichaceae bacterium]|nr:amidohydrolase family protein [Erysipelotrichaceae bacterium]